MGTYSPPSKRTHYLTLQEAATEGFGAYSTLRTWIAQGKLPVHKTGNRKKVLREDLKALTVPVDADPSEGHIRVIGQNGLVGSSPSRCGRGIGGGVRARRWRHPMGDGISGGAVS